MKLGFVFDTRFLKYKDDYYSVNLSSKVLTDRYLSVFDEMVVVGRFKEIQDSPEGRLIKCNNERIRFKCVRDAKPWERVINFAKDSKQIRETLKDCDAVICRGWRGTSICRQLNKPYLVEVVNCAWDSYWNHGVLGKIVAPVMYAIRRITTYRAPFVIYVTNCFLQRRYPTKGNTVAISNVALGEHSEDVLTQRLRRISNKSSDDKIVIGTAAAVDVPFKGQRFVIKALARLKKRGITNLEYQIAGGGNQQKLDTLARKLGVSDQVIFKGSIVHDEIFAWFDSLDIYIQPSLQEGLPRAMIEAMSRGVPCYGTKTGGIPELIDDACVCKANLFIADQLARFLRTYTKERAQKMAIQNYEKSMRYAADLLNNRRYVFLKEFAQNISGE